MPNAFRYCENNLQTAVNSFAVLVLQIAIYASGPAAGPLACRPASCPVFGRSNQPRLAGPVLEGPGWALRLSFPRSLRLPTTHIFLFSFVYALYRVRQSNHSRPCVMPGGIGDGAVLRAFFSSHVGPVLWTNSLGLTDEAGAGRGLFLRR